MRETSPLDQFIAQQLAHGRYHSQGMLAHTSQSQTRLSPHPSHIKLNNNFSALKTLPKRRVLLLNKLCDGGITRIIYFILDRMVDGD